MPLVIFDLDGTLLQTTGVDDACFIEAMDAALGIRGFETDWSRYAHATDTGLTHEIVRRHHGRAALEQEVRAVHDAFIALLSRQAAERPDRFARVPGVEPMLARVRAMRGAGWGFGLATGAWRASALTKLRAAGLALDDFAGAYADDDPSRRRIILTAAARAMNLEPPAADGPAESAVLDAARRRWGGVVYVGDGVWDAQTSRGLGIGFVGVRTRGDFDRLRSAGATALVRGYEDLPALLTLIESQAERPTWA